MDAAVPRHVVRLGETEVVAQCGQSGPAVLRGVGACLLQAVDRPVGHAVGAYAALRPFLLHRVDELVDAHLEIVAVHQVQVHVVGVQSVQRLRQLAV
jgi:hypothetical protein